MKGERLMTSLVVLSLALTACEDNTGPSSTPAHDLGCSAGVYDSNLGYEPISLNGDRLLIYEVGKPKMFEIDETVGSGSNDANVSIVRFEATSLGEDENIWYHTQIETHSGAFVNGSVSGSYKKVLKTDSGREVCVSGGLVYTK